MSTETKPPGICPFCRETVSPEVTESNVFRRDVCKCPEYGSNVLVCRTPGCTDFAKGGNTYDDELCPQCTASVTSGAGEVVKWGAMTAAGVVATVLLSKKDSD